VSNPNESYISPLYAVLMESSGSGRAEWERELDVRTAALTAGVWLGWFSVAAVLLALALGIPAHHRLLVALLMLAAGVTNGLVRFIPVRWWSTQRRSETLLALWSGGLLALAGAVVLLAGARSDFSLLLFLGVPFLATIHSGRQRVLWLAVAIGGMGVVLAVGGGFDAAAVALRAVLWAGAAALAVWLADLNRRAAAAQAELRERAELERLLLAEAHHRVKNSLQTVADLLLLGRPEGADGKAFDETAERIRAIAVVHRLLAERRGADVSAAELLGLLVEGIAPGASVTAVDVRLDATRAQHVGMVANELIANAAEHGRGPIEVELSSGEDLVLAVRDHGDGFGDHRAGLGLTLVERIVGQSLGGSFTVEHTPAGLTEAKITFDQAD
jgi:two-component sensor histidine kinase